MANINRICGLSRIRLILYFSSCVSLIPYYYQWWRLILDSFFEAMNYVLIDIIINHVQIKMLYISEVCWNFSVLITDTPFIDYKNNQSLILSDFAKSFLSVDETIKIINPFIDSLTNSCCGKMILTKCRHTVFLDFSCCFNMFAGKLTMGLFWFSTTYVRLVSGMPLK